MNTITSGSSPKLSDFLKDAPGEMPARVRQFDWSGTSLGPIDHWPHSLRTITDCVLRSPVAQVVLWGSDGVMIYNDEYAHFAGGRHPSLLGSKVREGWPEVADFNDNVMRVGLAGGTLVYHDRELKLRRHGRLESGWMNLYYSPVIGDDGKPAGVLAVVFETTQAVLARRELHAELTARAESEAAMRASEARLRELNTDLERRVLERSFTRGQVWKLSPDLLGAVDLQARVQMTNPAWMRMLGYSEDELRGADMFALLHPDDLEHSRAAFYAITNSRPALGVANRVRHKDGSYRWISWVAAMEGEVIYGMGRDITPEKIAAQELEATQAKLRQSQKMEALGQMTGGVAHDFNNLLAAISGSLELLEVKLRGAGIAGVDGLIELAQRSAQRGASLTQRLLAFARQQQLDPRPTDVNRLVLGLEELVRRTVGPHIVVEFVCAGGLWQTLIDAAQLENALLNLAINARDAMARGGRLRVETANERVGQDGLPGAAARDGALPGDYVVLRVVDTGCGMSPEVLGRACDPFFTTKPLGEGTGLGLSMIQGFVHQSGGHMHLRSAVGTGTAVTLRFPRHLGEAGQESEITVDPVPAGESAPAQQRGSILVIDDEPGIREVIVMVLREEGYRLCEAADGHEGLAFLKADTHFDLLITDVGLPGGLNGREVADLARALRPGLKVLFATGYAEQSLIGKGQLETGMRVLRKPFALDLLTETVRELLDEV